MSIAKKFMYALTAILLLGVVSAVLLVYHHQRELAQQRAVNESNSISREAIRLLTVTNNIMMEREKVACSCCVSTAVSWVNHSWVNG